MVAVAASDTKDVDVIIIGGGGCGLTLSNILSDQGVDHILFERHEQTSYLPKAHYLNQRTMEIFRQHGLAEKILEKTGIMKYISKIEWLSSLGGNGPYDRMHLGSVDTFGGNDDSDRARAYVRDSPVASHNLPLIRLEPILRKCAEDRNPGRVLFSHAVTDFTPTEDFVLVTVEDREGNESHYRAKYLVGADGGKTVGPKIGVEMQGPTGLVDIVSVHFKADLSDYWDDRNFLAHFINPGGGNLLNSGALAPVGPTWGRFSEEWILHFGFSVNDESRWDETRLVPRIRQLLNLPEVDLEVLHINHWVIERVLANKYQEGRCFVAGDAAHRRPPTTGLGLNTAVGDAHNLAWKLSLVLKQKAGPQLLDTYEVERRPIGKRNCDWGLITFMNTAVIDSAIGLKPGQQEWNETRFAAIFEDSDTGASLRSLIQETISGQKIEFSAHDIELGYSYSDGAIVTDGTPRPSPDPLGQVYTPTTRPGHRLPHAWIRDRSSVSMDLQSTHDLVGSEGNFLLIADAEGRDWEKAAAQAEQSLGISVRCVTVDVQPLYGKEAKYIDHNSVWSGLKQVGKGGAVLVRPDNMVAWRGAALPKDSISTLNRVLSGILGRD